MLLSWLLSCWKYCNSKSGSMLGTATFSDTASYKSKGWRFLEGCINLMHVNTKNCRFVFLPLIHSPETLSSKYCYKCRGKTMAYAELIIKKKNKSCPKIYRKYVTNSSSVCVRIIRVDYIFTWPIQLGNLTKSQLVIIILLSNFHSYR